MNTVILRQPRRIVFGCGCAIQAADDLIAIAAPRNVFVVTARPVAPLAAPIIDKLTKAFFTVTVYDKVNTEPTVAMFNDAMVLAEQVKPAVVIGIGGGSALDLAKLVAALHNRAQKLQDAWGIGNLAGRGCFLVCLPTTSGTGSEVSPNALLLDDSDGAKKAVVSPHLVPDAAYIDPLLTVCLPSEVTAATGMDALIHCMEAYTNLFAHPAVDLYALKGVELISHNLTVAVADGTNVEAREKLSLGSLYGGLCLGPVNTAAVHALSYPLGTIFHLPHGLANAVLLPAVMEFNIPAAPGRYADVAVAMGVRRKKAGDLETSLAGLTKVRQLIRRCGLAKPLRKLGVTEDRIGQLAQAAMKVTRLLKNNPRPLTQADAEAIYRKAF